MDAHDLNIDPTAWWWILLAGIAFIVGGLAVALNRIQERRPPEWKDATMAPGPEGVGKSWVKAVITVKDGPKFLEGRLFEARKVMDPNGPFPKCRPVFGSSLCYNCGRLIDPDDASACSASEPSDRWSIEWPMPSKNTDKVSPQECVDLSPGNIDLLTRSQVGDGWRIADHSEEPHPDAQVWEPYYKSWARRMFNASKPYERTCTYRVPIKGKD